MRPDRSAAEWAHLAVRTQRRVDAAARIFGWGSRPYFRRLHLRNAAGQIAEALGLNPWGFIASASREVTAQFHHLFDAGIQ